MRNRTPKVPRLPGPRPGVTITKIDAARRQLETAILLYFRDVDAVSVHTLAAAAHEIVSAINRKKAQSEPMISEWVLEQIKPEYRQEISEQTKGGAELLQARQP